MAKHKSFAEAAKSVTEAPPAETGGEERAIEFRKFTVPLREDQLEDMAKALARLTYEEDVTFSKAVLIRLALDELLLRLDSDPDSVIYDLYALELKEMAGNENRKFSASKGAEEYLQEIGRL